MRERGFNQSARIAKVIAETMRKSGATLAPHVLTRKRNTPPQARLSKRLRSANMYGAFAVRDARSCKYKDVILVDDVVTTGATMRAARVALEKAGARSVLCVAAAH
jgi:predicted amidophosphoribosyltransferase